LKSWKEYTYLRENGSGDGCGTVMLHTDDMVLIELGVRWE